MKPLPLPQTLRAWRARKKLTAKAAAAQLGANLRTYEDWEQARYTPRGLALSALLERIK